MAFRHAYQTSSTPRLGVYTFWTVVGVCIIGLNLLTAPYSPAQVGGGVGNGLIQTGVVGGVMIDADDVLQRSTKSISLDVKGKILDSLRSVDAAVNRPSDLRAISLKALDQQIQQSVASGQALPVEVQFMAGLQRVEYVIVDEVNGDILIAGPAEPLTTDALGNIVGANSSTPAIHLEDFLVAMRASQNARTGQGITVSIDPTAEGMQNLQRFYDSVQFSPQVVGQLENAMGHHNISLTGVPKDSRFSQVLVAADYRMKRLAMGLEPSNARDLPSVLDLAVKAGARRMKGAPRMWMECNYEPVATDEDNSIWQLQGQGVGVLTEEAIFDKQGDVVKQAKGKAKQNKFAKKWADTMTERFEEVSQVEPVFRDLRNVMDLSVVAAIIDRNELLTRFNVGLSAITDATLVATPSRPTPGTVPTQCSFVNIRDSYVVTASGGVQIDSWSVAENVQVVASLTKTATGVKSANAADNGKWFWDVR